MTAKKYLIPRPAATVIIARDADDGLEIFMMRRTEQMVFVGGNYVFPGGGLEAADSDLHWASLCDGMEDADASRLLGIAAGGLAYWIAALRECFEESGLLMCRDQRGELVTHDDDTLTGKLAELRSELIAGKTAFADLLQAHQLRPALDQVAYFSHWITPIGAPRRYDTRFLVTAVPLNQTASHDGDESDHHHWIRPADALERQKKGEIQMIAPTIETLKTLAQFADSAALMAYARTPRDIPAILPRRAGGRDGTRSLRPGDAAYAEVGKLDPGMEGTASYEIIPGVVTRLSPRVRRITAPNPGFMTGPGTNSYLIAAGKDVAIIDPGPALDGHIDALLAEAQRDGGRIRWLLATHTHTDHSPAAQRIKNITGAELIGRPPPEHGNQDRDFAPDIEPANGERLHIAGCTVRAVHTPGHASNQVIYLLEEENMLFTGDHVMQGSTVVIGPPDGNMVDYFNSLRAAQAVGAEWIAPGHGFLIADPKKAIERIIKHRLEREAKVLEAVRTVTLSNAAGGTLDELVVKAYDDVPAKVHTVAARSLHAHLIKLQSEGQISKSGERWTA
jgi:glyoxylase-like metal-dependent hydrolase (beta-lactamase superfamily II)